MAKRQLATMHNAIAPYTRETHVSALFETRAKDNDVVFAVSKGRQADEQLRTKETFGI
jgi:hypothetical protein